MECQPNSANDKLELLNERRSSTNTANAWLVQQAIIYLNSSDREAEISYKHTIELLVKSQAIDSIIQMIRTTSKTDVTLQWSLLYLLGDIRDKTAAKWLSQYTIEQLPARGQSCEGPRDGELLLRTMALESLKKIAMHNAEVSELILEIISQHPDRELLIEAVKAAVELGLKEKVVEILPREEHWIIDIRKAKIEELQADSEKVDTKEVGYTPPKRIADYNAPSTKCACTKGGPNHG